MESDQKIELSTVFEGTLGAAREVSSRFEAAGIGFELGTADGVEPGT